MNNFTFLRNAARSGLAAAMPLALLAMAVAPSSSLAANKFWNGGTGNWGTAANWDPAGVPVNGDDLFFPTLGAGAFTTTTNNIGGAARRFRSVNFTAGGYIVRGNAIVVSNGVASVSGAGANTLSIDVTLAGNQTFANSTPNFTISGDIDLAGFNLTLDASDAGEFFVLSGAISGTGNLTKIGDGFLNLSGTTTNTYVGSLTINSGELRLAKGDNVTAVTGDLILAAGTTARWFNSEQVSDAGDVVVGNGGSLILGAHTETLGPLDLTGATISSTTGSLGLNGNVICHASATSTTISGNLFLGNVTRTLDVAAGAAVDELVISATISGGSRLIGFPVGIIVYAGIIKTGDGRLVLSGTNTYGGGFTANDGFTRVESDGAFGFVPILGIGGGVVINPGAEITLANVDIATHSLTVNRPSPPAALSGSGVSSWSGPVTLNTNVTFTTGGTLAFSNSISGPGGVRLIGNVFRFAGTNANTYTGNTELTDGTLQLAKPGGDDAIPNGTLLIGDGDGADTVFYLAGNQIGTSVDITISDSGLLNLNNFSDFTGDLIFEGGRVMTGSGTITPDNIIVNPTNVTATISGELNLSGTRTWTVHDGSASPCDLLVSAIIGSGGSLIKNGAGTLCLGGNNTYTGATTVNEGQLVLQHANALGATVNGTMVNSNALLTLEGGIAVGPESLTLNSAGLVNLGTLLSQGGDNSWAGIIVLQTDAIINVAAATDDLTVSSSISGPGSLTKINRGSLTLAGASGNTFTGLTFAREGVVNLSKSAGVAVPNDLMIGLNGIIISPIAARVNNLNGAQVNGTVTVNGTGAYDVNTFVESIDGLNLNDGGDVIIDAGGLLEVFTGSVTTSDSSALFGSGATISGAGEFAVGPGSRTFNIPEGAGVAVGDPAELIISARVVGAASITKIGSGDLSLTASNNFVGSLTIEDGEVRISHDRALGATGGTTRVNGDAVLSLSGNIDVLGESLTLDSTGQPANGALESTSGTNLWSGLVSLAQSTVINVETNSSLTLSGAVGGFGDLRKVGPGTLVFSGASANIYSGTTLLNEGVLECRKSIADGAIPHALVIGDGVGGANTDILRTIGPGAGQLNDTSDVTINSSGRWEMSVNETIGGLQGSGNLDLGSSPLLFGDGVNRVFDGLISGGAASALNKTGTGIVTFNANNTYSGPTAVLLGTLLVNGNQANSDVTVSGGATLGGAGRVGDLDVNNLGNLAPGASPGRLSSSNAKLDPGSNFRVELNGPAVGAGYDQLNVVSMVDINGALLLPTKSPGYAPADGAVHTIINNGGAPVTGTFGGRPEGSIVTLNQIDFRLSYVGGTGNDVTLTVTNIPLRFASTRVEAGNGNGRVDPNECDHLFVALENRGAGTISGITARLDSLTPAVSITQPDSPYPNIPALGFGTNTIPFQIRVSPDFICGQNISLSLVVSAAGEGTFAVPFTLNSGTPASFVTLNSTNVPKAILDLDTTNSIIIVTNQFSIRKVRVSLHATHPAAGDLRFRLRAPNGAEVLLSANRGGNAANYGNSCAARTIFDDDAATKITAASAPFAGTFAPEENLAAFIGLNAAGVWRLFVDDTVAGDTGTLQCWSLLLAPGSCASGGGECESCLATVSGTLAPGSPTLAERLSRNGVPSGCGNVKPCPGTLTGDPFRFRLHTFTNTGPDACITVVLNVPCDGATNDLQSAAYLTSFNSADLCANYLGDSGQSIFGGSVGYTFRVPAGARFIVLVNEVNVTGPNQGCGNYTLDLHGLPCPPPTLFVEKVPTPPNRVRLRWSTAYPEYQLQRSPHLNGAPPFPFANVLTAPVVIGGDYSVTNTATANDDYFRLRRP